MLTIDGLIAVISLFLTAFDLGYAIGRINAKMGECPKNLTIFRTLSISHTENFSIFTMFH